LLLFNLFRRAGPFDVRHSEHTAQIALIECRREGDVKHDSDSEKFLESTDYAGRDELKRRRVDPQISQITQIKNSAD
jgi:hypothetical protein